MNEESREILWEALQQLQQRVAALEEKVDRATSRFSLDERVTVETAIGQLLLIWPEKHHVIVGLRALLGRK
jgi:hypothetical protein